MNEIQKFEADYLASVKEAKEVPTFKAGDTIKVNYRIVEGNKERIQAYQGVCISRKNAGINSAFTVRKVSNGEGIERLFPLYGPRVDSIEVVRKGVVRRAKLYYMRDLSGKAARIKEKLDFLPKAEREAIAKQAEKKAEAAPKVEAKTEAPAEKKESSKEDK